MKKLLSLALACTLTLGLASCGGTGTSTSSNAPASSSAVESPAAQFDAASYLSGDYPKLPEDGPAYSLSIGHAMQESTESHKMLLALKDAVEKYSDGKITITIYPNSQLGSDSEMIASCVAGDMDMVLQCGSTHATFVPETVIFDIPFLFSGYDSEKIESVLTDSKFRDLYNQANEDGGLVPDAPRRHRQHESYLQQTRHQHGGPEGAEDPHRSGGEPDGGLECIGCQPDSHGFQ